VHKLLFLFVIYFSSPLLLQAQDFSKDSYQLSLDVSFDKMLPLKKLVSGGPAIRTKIPLQFVETAKEGWILYGLGEVKSTDEPEASAWITVTVWGKGKQASKLRIEGYLFNDEIGSEEPTTDMRLTPEKQVRNLEKFFLLTTRPYSHGEVGGAVAGLLSARLGCSVDGPRKIDAEQRVVSYPVLRVTVDGLELRGN
jgi:hypothetical protein